jgi:hypothetical protein
MASIHANVAKDSWMQPPMARHWNFGYKTTNIFKILNSLPEPMLNIFEQVIESIVALFGELNKTMRTVHTMIGSKSVDENSIACMESDFSSQFESERDIGLIQIDYDPLTQSRKHFALNTFLANLWGMTKDELILRFADYDVPLPYSELDWLRTLIFELETHVDTNTTRYSRLIFGTGQAARTALVQVTTNKSFDADGQIFRVRLVLSCRVRSFTTWSVARRGRSR